MEKAADWVMHYGYAGIFSLLALGILGLPIPDETILMFVGFLISRGRLHAIGAFVSAFTGTICGVTLSYALGRNFSVYVNWYRYLHLGPERIGRVQDWFRRAGRWVLALGYFVPGVRHITAYVAGVSGLPFLEYAVFAYTGGFFWSLTLISIGYFLGESWVRRQMPLQHDLGVFVGIALVAILLYLRLRKKT